MSTIRAFIASLNLLSVKQQFQTGLASGCQGGGDSLKTEHRAKITPNVLIEFMKQGRILCLQEVCPETFAAFGLAELFAEYGYDYAYKTYAEEPYTLGVLTAWSKEKFTQVNMKHFVLVNEIDASVKTAISTKAKATPKVDGKAAVTTASLLHNKPHILLGVRLRNADGAEIVIGNTHLPMLFASPKDCPDRSVIQTAYTVLTTTAAAKLHEFSAGTPCLLAGDWNCQPSIPVEGSSVPHPAHVALTSRQDPASYPCPIVNTALTALYASGYEPLTSAATAVHGAEFPVTNATCKVDEKGVKTNTQFSIGRIYIGGGHPTAATLYPSEVAAKPEEGFLSLTWSSDHVAFLADITIGSTGNSSNSSSSS